MSNMNCPLMKLFLKAVLQWQIQGPQILPSFRPSGYLMKTEEEKAGRIVLERV